jgi:molybdenum cofactor guanylyltransferase
MPLTIPSRHGFIIAGGKSSRMGSDKAFLNFRGQTLLEHALNVLHSLCEEIAIVGDPAKFSPLAPVIPAPVIPAPIIKDIFPNCGPLAGIHAALLHSTADLNLMLAVDMPFISTDLLAFLFTVAEETAAIVTVPRTAKGFQPLCAIYRRDFAAIAEHALRAGNYKIDATFSTIPTRIIEPPQLAASGFTEQLFFNLNTPADHQTAGRIHP